jgi:hypothetical protein
MKMTTNWYSIPAPVRLAPLIVILACAFGAASGAAIVRAGTGVGAGARHAALARADTLPLAFRHESHGELECETCHRTGRATARGLMPCAGCHHEEVTFSECARCHNPGEFEPGAVVVEQSFQLTVADQKTANLTFEHRPHLPLGCAECHGTGGGVRVDRECSTCHENHHRPEANCRACHVLPQGDAHRPAVHTTTCTTTGCHGVAAVVYRGELDNRYLCLVCHEDRRRHEPFGVCTNCHMVDGK